MTAKQKRQLGYALITISIVGIGYQFFRQTKLQARFREGMSRCRRATHDLLRLQGAGEIDAVNQAGDYCGQDGDLYGEAP